MAENYYTPGVCNLNEPEIAYRRKAFYLGLIIGIPLLLILLVLGAAPIVGVLMFLPAWIGAIGYLQAKNKFCVAYGASGVYNSSPEYAETQKIVDAAFKKLDKARARKMNTQAFVIGIVVTALTVALLALI